MSNPDLFRRWRGLSGVTCCCATARSPRWPRSGSWYRPLLWHALPLAAPQDVPEPQPGARPDRLPLQRARLRRVVTPMRGRSSISTQPHQILRACDEAVRGAGADLSRTRRSRYGELWDEARAFAGGLQPARPRPRRARRDLPRQADRDGGVGVRHLGGRRRVRAGQPAAAAAAGRPHPRRLRRPRARDLGGAARACCATSSGSARRSST